MSRNQVAELADRLETGVFEYRIRPDRVVETLFVNRAFRRLFRVAEGVTETPETHFLSYIEPQERIRVIDQWCRCHAAGLPFEQDYRFRFPEGHVGLLSFHSKPRALADGTRIWDGYAVDLSRNHQALEAASLRLQRMALTVASASHELKTPLHGIALLLQWLQQNATDEPTRLEVARARQAARSLGLLIDDLLALGQIETGRSPLRPAPVNLRALMADVADSFAPHLRNRNLRLTVTIAASVPTLVLVDVLRLRQILSNLTGNAIRYTRQGQIHWRIGPGEASPPAPGEPQAAMGPSVVQFEITDTGPGIAPERLASIFEPFGSAAPVGDNADDDVPGAGSTGLGLSICRRLVEWMGGSIQLHSSLGVGTRVTFRIALPSPATL